MANDKTVERTTRYLNVNLSSRCLDPHAEVRQVSAQTKSSMLKRLTWIADEC